MKTTEFKVHTIYTKDDILQMQKVVTRPIRRIGLLITGAIFVVYLAAVLWELARGEGFSSVFSFVDGGVLDAVLLIILAVVLAVLAALPYLQTRGILKSAPKGGLRANFYFYGKTFQYGWGDCFTTIPYAKIQEFRPLEKTFYIKADDTSYWVKKSDFQVGTPEKFQTFMEEKISGNGRKK